MYYYVGVPTSSSQDYKAQLGDHQIRTNPEVNRKLLKKSTRYSYYMLFRQLPVHFRFDG